MKEFFVTEYGNVIVKENDVYRILNSRVITHEDFLKCKTTDKLEVIISRLIEYNKKDFKYIIVDINCNISLCKIPTKNFSDGLIKAKDKIKYTKQNVHPIVIFGDGEPQVDFENDYLLLENDHKLKDLISSLGLYLKNNKQDFLFGFFENFDFLIKYVVEYNNK